MLSSGIIDLAIGLAFIFGVTAALASVITEMIARFLGLELLWIAVVAARLALGRPAPVTARAPAPRPRQPERR